MRTTSRRSLWLLLAGAVLTGWCSASIVSPPVAGTQTLPTRARAAADTVIPVIALASVTPRTPPTTLRNPFAFGSAREAAPSAAVVERAKSESGLQTPGGADVSATAPVGADEGWRLIGIATSGSGATAVLTGPSGIVLASAGDRLPDGWTVLAVTDSTATLARDAGSTLVLRLP